MIIDTHVHIGNMLNFNMSEEDVIYSMDKYGIDYSIVSSINAAEFDHSLRLVPEEYQHSQCECLKDAVAFAKKYPDRIGAAVWARPFVEKADYDLYKAIEDNRKLIKAIKFHPFHSNVPFDSEIMEPYIELAERYELPAVVHTGGSDAASCIRVFNMAKKHPRTNFVMVHMGLGTDNKEAIELVSKLPNLFGDTTWVPLNSTIQLIKTAGIEKVVFGSDNPIDGKDTYLHNGFGERSLYQQYFNEARDLLSAEDYDRLMYKNALSLFNISTTD